MIAKILTSSSSFAGVAYNERKNEKGQSELLVAKNFDLNESATKKDYKDYLIAMAGINQHVKKPQFHATISCKGREYSFEELKDIAEQWTDKMGYGKQPYLIYAHSDTANNHVHIVSVRVDENGKKISDSYENLRSQRVLNEIMKFDYSQKAERDFKNFSSYNFSTVAQFKLLFENAGWNVAEKDGKIFVNKGGEQRKTIEKSLINDLINNNVNVPVPDEQRAKQISALLHKYKEGLTHTELKDLMKSKFGIDLIYHTGKDHTTPYGYSVIDHSGRKVYKGSDLVNIKELLVTPERENKITACSALVEMLLNSPKSFEAFKTELQGLGYNIDTKGKIYIKGEKQGLFSLNKEDLKMLRYNSRKNEAGKFNVTSRGEAVILSKLFFVRANDIPINNKDRDINTVLFYRDMMNSYLSTSGDIKQVMTDKNITFLQMGKELYLIDSSNKEIINNNDLNIYFNSRELEAIRLLDSDRLNDFDIEKEHKVASGIGLIDTLSEFLDQNFNGQEDRKRKRKQQDRN
jgi:hypothetical protein